MDNLVILIGVDSRVNSSLIKLLKPEAHVKFLTYESLVSHKYDDLVLNACVVLVNLINSENSHVFLPKIIEYCTGKNMVVYHEYPQRIYAEKYLDMGVNGYLTSDTTITEIKHALYEICKGNTYVSSKVNR